MKNSTKTSLDIAKLVAPIVGSREAVRDLKKTITKEKSTNIDLDFRNVEFVSRSAAHEFLMLKEALARKMLSQKTIAFVHVNQEVKDMFRAIAANRAVPKSAKPEFTAKTISIESLMGDGHKATA